MTPQLTPYPAYKDSGAPWLPDIPSEWRLLRAKNIFRPIDVRSETGDEELLTVSSNDGVVPRSQKTVTMFKAESYVGHKLCWPGDLVINSLWAWMQGLGFARQHGLVSSAYGVYRPYPEFRHYASYFNYALRSAAYKWELVTRSKGVWLSRLQISDGAFLDMPVLVPPPDEQSAIVCFLEQADRRIRRYIRAKQKLIGLLNEQKQAVIHRAVTRGLDRNVRLKPSGVEWLGDVPHDWQVQRLRNIVDIRVSSVDKHTKHGEYSVRLCNYADAYKNDHITTDMPFMRATASPDEIARFRLEEGDVLITKDSEIWTDIAVPSLVQQSADDLICGYHLALLRPVRRLVDGAYLLRALQCPCVAYQSHVEAHGVTRFGLSQSAIKSIRIPLPPLPEQAAIVRFLEEATADLDHAAAVAQRQSALLREYRTRLIADVVTGKVDVRHLELPGAYELAEDEELLEQEALKAGAETVESEPDEEVQDEQP